MKRNHAVLAGLIAATAALVASAGVSAASPSSIGTFTLSGQSKGSLEIAKGETCKADNISIARGVATVRLYFTDKDVKPTNDLWYVLISSKGIEAHYPSSTATFTLGVNAGARTYEQWGAGAKFGSGSVTFTDHFQSGTLNVSLVPAAGQKGATRTEKIAGTWYCAH